jgi:MFS-type transporter involved in bile tolerance (Atg22 family)
MLREALERALGCNVVVLFLMIFTKTKPASFDTDKKVLHNLASLLVTVFLQAKCRSLFFKNLTTDKCGRLMRVAQVT